MAGEPVLTQTRVARFLSSPQRVDVGMIGGQAARHLGTLGNSAVAGDHDIDVPGGLTQPVECRFVGTHLIGAARVEERDQDVGERVAGEQDATVRPPAGRTRATGSADERASARIDVVEAELVSRAMAAATALAARAATCGSTTSS